MNALAPIGTGEDAAAARTRHDGWTPDRQRAFLKAIAEGHSVDSACRRVAMSPSSAYALRRRAAGGPFPLGWDAANLLARGRIADTLLARAIDGQVETYTRPDGASFSRHRLDNRLAAQMLARLDRYADEAAPAGSANHAARLIAADFDQYLDLVDRDEGPARLGLFLGARIAADEVDADLRPIMALARADRWLRTGAGLASEVDAADLDPARRAEWTAEQWLRAEAAGLVALSGGEVEDDAWDCELSPLWDDDDDDFDEDADGAPVWFDEARNRWRTRFPPARRLFRRCRGPLWRPVLRPRLHRGGDPHDRYAASRLPGKAARARLRGARPLVRRSRPQLPAAGALRLGLGLCLRMRRRMHLRVKARRRGRHGRSARRE